MFIIAIFFGVLLMILGFVIPRIARVFVGLRVELPFATRMLINASNYMRANYFGIAAVVIGLAIFTVLLFKLKKAFIVNLIFKLPLLSKLGTDIDLSRFTRSMALLLKSGVPIGEALDLSKTVVVKRQMVKMTNDMSRAISEGRPMFVGMKNSKKHVPVLMQRLLETAEKSGSLEISMQKLSDHFQTKVSHQLKSIVTLVEPIMIVVVGVMVGGMMLAIIAPIYGLIGKVQAR